MKKLFTLLMLVMIVMTISAQTVMFKVEAARVTETEDWTDIEKEDVTESIIVTFNEQDQEIRIIFEESVFKFYIRKTTQDTVDDGEYIQNYMLYECINSKGVLCDVVVSWFEDDTIAFDGTYVYKWSIYYGNMWVAYYCNSLQ